MIFFMIGGIFLVLEGQKKKWDRVQFSENVSLTKEVNTICLFYTFFCLLISPININLASVSNKILTLGLH